MLIKKIISFRNSPRHKYCCLNCWNGNFEKELGKFKYKNVETHYQQKKSTLDPPSTKYCGWEDHQRCREIGSQVEIALEILSRTTSLQGKIIKAKYGEENKWMTKEVFTPYDASLWLSIRVRFYLLRCMVCQCSNIKIKLTAGLIKDGTFSLGETSMIGKLIL